MCIGGRLGMELKVEDARLFAEVNGCLLVEVSPSRASEFERHFENLPLQRVGAVTSAPILKFNKEQIQVEELVKAFNKSI
jgi:hypothetical protein